MSAKARTPIYLFLHLLRTFFSSDIFDYVFVDKFYTKNTNKTSFHHFISQNTHKLTDFSCGVVMASAKRVALVLERADRKQKCQPTNART